MKNWVAKGVASNVNDFSLKSAQYEILEIREHNVIIWKTIAAIHSKINHSTLKQQFKVAMIKKKWCILWNTWIRISNNGHFGLIWVPFHAVGVILTGPEFLLKLTLNMLWLSPRLFFTILFLLLQILPIQPGYSGVTHVGFWTHCSLVGLYLVCDWLSRTTRLLFSCSSPISW